MSFIQLDNINKNKYLSIDRNDLKVNKKVTIDLS